MTQKNIVEIENLSFGYDNRMLHKDINMVFPMAKSQLLWVEAVVAKRLFFV